MPGEHRIVIDEDVCQGHALCSSAAPTLIGLDERGYGVVLGDGIIGDENQQSEAQRAELGCPERAITIEEVR